MPRKLRKNSNGYARKQRKQTNKQAGKALVKRIAGDAMQINHPDGGAPPLKTRVLKYQKQGPNGFGSHLNGRHKQG